MNDLEPSVGARDFAVATVAVNAVTWRYLGDRDAADRAYCIRFAVDAAPEPSVAPGGALAYPVPSEERRP